MQSLHILLLLLSWTFFSCVADDERQERKSATVISSAEKTERVDTAKLQIVPQASPLKTDTLTIDIKAAVFYQPDSFQMEKRMKEVGEAEFRMGADDYIYYINRSVEFLEVKGLKVFDAKNNKYLKFVFANKQVQVIKLDALEELWGIYLFDPKKNPYAADMAIIKDEYKNYFE